MSNIEENLRKIQESRYGREVRGAIHDAIHDCYEDGRAGATDLIAREMVTAEQTARAEAVSAEQTARAAAVSAEQAARAEAITAEQEARMAADTAEQQARAAAVSAEQIAREAAVATLESTKADKTQLASPFNFKGSCTYAELPTENNEVNDTYYVTDMKARYSWNGTAWYQSGLNEGDYEDELTAIKEDLAQVDSRLSESIVDISTDVNTLEESVLAEKKLKINLNKGAYETSLNTGTNKWAYCVVDKLGETEISVPDGYRYSVYTYSNGTGGTRIYSTRTAKIVFTATEKFVVNFARTDANALTDSDYEVIKNSILVNHNYNSLESKIRTYNVANIFSNDLYYDDAITINRLVSENGSRTTSAYGASTSLITIHAPICLFVPKDFMVCVNQYTNRFSWNNFDKNIIPYTDEREIVVACDSYPSVIGIGIKRVNGSEVTSADVGTLSNNFAIKTIMPKPLYASFSMFKDIAVTGCSWDAGTCYSSVASAVSRTGLGWAENIGRRNGCNVHNYAIGGTSLRTWFNFTPSEDDYGKQGMKGLLEDEAQPLYILLNGNVNDANVSQTVNRGFIRNDDSTVYPWDKVYRVGSIADLSASDYHDYPTTYYGYYGREIEMILAHAPNACIIITSPDTNVSSSAIYRDFEVANKEIAEHYGLPFIELTADPYYYVYLSKLRGNHPLALTYSGFAMQMERQFAKCVEENEQYFERYNNTNRTVYVPWEEVN